jgi:hypothetical protein
MASLAEQRHFARAKAQGNFYEIYQSAKRHVLADAKHVGGEGQVDFKQVSEVIDLPKGVRGGANWAHAG